MRLLAFSDLHCDLVRAAEIVERSAEADAVVCAGDLASVHRGLTEVVDVLRAIEVPTLVVPGNNETDQALRDACRGWDAATVLHGEGQTIGTTEFFGLGGGVPVTPWDWSFDLTEQAAAESLAGCPEGAVLVVHSPPKGHGDRSRGRSLGSEAIRETILERRPRLAVCGHIHESWGVESVLGETRVLNLGPEGTVLEVA